MIYYRLYRTEKYRTIQIHRYEYIIATYIESGTNQWRHSRFFLGSKLTTFPTQNSNWGEFVLNGYLLDLIRFLEVERIIWFFLERTTNFLWGTCPIQPLPICATGTNYIICKNNIISIDIELNNNTLMLYF